MLKGLFAAFLAMASGSPALAEWHEARSKHFVIYADMKAARIQEFANRLETFDAAVRKVRGMADPELTDANRLTVYALNNQRAVGKLAGSSSVAGQYMARASGSLAFVPRSTGGAFSASDLEAETIFFHEYAHHLQLQDADVALPAWVREGFAEFFSTARIEKDGSVVIGLPANHRAFTLLHVRGIQIEDMLSGELRRRTPQELDRFYARGWLLMHYLTFNAERKGQLRKYMDGIQAGTKSLDAAKAAFGDLRRLDSELDTYVEGKFTSLRVDPGALVAGPVKVRQMSAAEAAIMPVRIRSKYGVNQKTAPRVADDARRIAVQYPNDPFVQATLAEAEYDAGHYAAAEAAADRALAANPRDVHALIYKGRVRVELARADPTKANWSEVRSWFQRANKLDTENAEALLLFFKSYLDAGAKPTPNAVEALLYAVALVPQDDGLRMNAVIQLLAASRLREAKAMFAPLAFNPHASDEWRARCAKVIAAMDRNNGKSALEALEAPVGRGAAS